MAPSMRSLAVGAFALLGALPSAVVAHSEADYENMGPMGFMWPEDREWIDDEHAMRGPCGSSDAPGNRTEFPLTNGALALEQKQLVFDVQVSVTFENNPTNASDFEVIIPHNDIRSLEYSHVCIDLPAMPASASAGQNATIRLQYVAEYIDPDHSHSKRHMPVNETFFSCADITLVETRVFDYDIPCFNVTTTFDSQGDHGHSHDDDDEGHDHEEEEESSSSSSGGPSLSGGDIAGIVIGSIVGVVVIATALWYFIRRDKREKQIVQHMTENRNGGKSVPESVNQATA